MTEATANITLNAIRILIVDDDQLNRSLLRAIFEGEGCRVVLAEGGADALDTFAAEPIDIVLLDLRMPGIDGIETLRRMRRVSANLPILMLTSHRDVAAAVEATRHGADDFITRPIENDELVARVALTLKHRRTADELEILRSKVDVGDFIHKFVEDVEQGCELEQLSEPIPLRALRRELIARIERKAISHAMHRADGNKAAAARLLRMGVTTLYTKLRRYDLVNAPVVDVTRRSIAQ